MIRTLTTDQLVESVKRRAMIPEHEVTFSKQDFIDILNEEFQIGLLPSVLKMHEEYYTYKHEVPLVSGVIRYPIPYRATGNKLRSLHWKDFQGHIYNMSRISPQDRTDYQRNYNINQTNMFYMENNDIVLISSGNSLYGTLVFGYYLRPNQLVEDKYGSLIQSSTSLSAETTTEFTYTNPSITFTNPITLYLGQEFVITRGTTTFSGNITAINSTTSYECNISGYTYAIDDSFTSVPATKYIVDTITTEMQSSSELDFVQSKSPNKIYDYDITPLSINSSAKAIVFNSSDIPVNLTIGDSICVAGQTIYPQIPNELIPLLCQRCATYCLESMGDSDGLVRAREKQAEMESNLMTLIDNRVEGSPLKAINRNSLLRSSVSRKYRRGVL